jgi:hypothetical protein
VNRTAYYGPPPSPPKPPYMRSRPPIPPSAMASRPAAWQALRLIREIAGKFADWREPDPDGDHTESLVVWLRLLDDLRTLYALLARLDPPPEGGER